MRGVKDCPTIYCRTMFRAVAMKFEVVQSGLTYTCMNYSAHKVSGGTPTRKSLDFRPSEVVSDAIFE